MWVVGRFGRGVSRRYFLASCSLLGLSAASRKGTSTPSEVERYADRTTEFPVTRLTNPEHASYLPNPYCRFISKGRQFLIHSSDRSGTLQAYRLDLKSGENRLLTEAEVLVPESLNLTPDDKSFLYLDASGLYEAGLGSAAPKRLYETPEGWSFGDGVCLARDGRHATFVEEGAGRSRIRLLQLKKRKVSTVIEESVRLSDPMPRPRHTSILFRLPDGKLRIVGYNGKGGRDVETVEGTTGPAVWLGSGSGLIYLNFPGEKGRLNTLREYYADNRQDRFVAKTTQFVGFGPNADASVFIGASGGTVSPHIILLLRAGGREMTLCEHGASDPSKTTPVFSPDSRQIFYQSDRDGKSAIYTMVVDDLVESTES